MKIKINDNYTNIFNYIHASENRLTIYDLIQYCIDYDQYQELYNNYHIFKDLLKEHNIQIELKQIEEENKQNANIEEIKL